MALVTGGTSGIGAETVRRLVAEGARVVVGGRSQERGRALVAELGPAARFVAQDLTAPDAAQALVAQTQAAFGRLDVLVNNAAIDYVGELLAVPPGDVRAVFAVNVFAALELLQETARVMPDGGSIVNVTSRLASVGVPTMAIYGAAKGALAALTIGAAVELAPLGVRVNAVAPGATATPLYDAWVAASPDGERAAREAAARIPQGRLAQPRDVAAAIAFLASDDAAHITGTAIAVDGGYTAA